MQYPFNFIKSILTEMLSSHRKNHRRYIRLVYHDSLLPDAVIGLWLDNTEAVQPCEDSRRYYLLNFNRLNMCGNRLNIHRTATGYQITQGGHLYTCDADLKHFRKAGQISERYIPSGRLLRQPSKRLIFYLQNQISKL